MQYIYIILYTQKNMVFQYYIKKFIFLHLCTFIQKSKSKMVKNFLNKFENSESTIFVMEDYDKGSYNM